MIHFPDFPQLAGRYTKTSEEDASYNCIAWAAGRNNEYWWPDANGVWPITEKKETIECFVNAFLSLGYSELPGDNERLEAGVEKVAIFAIGTEPTHAARQMPNGRWTSKMGVYQEDIEHEWGAVDGPAYGTVARILRRGTSQDKLPDSPTGWRYISRLPSTCIRAIVRRWRSVISRLFQRNENSSQ